MYADAVAAVPAGRGLEPTSSKGGGRTSKWDSSGDFNQRSSDAGHGRRETKPWRIVSVVHILLVLGLLGLAILILRQKYLRILYHS